MEMYSVKEVAKILNCCLGHGYKVIRELNAELKKQGYMIHRGRVPKKYFEERFGMR